MCLLRKLYQLELLPLKIYKNEILEHIEWSFRWFMNCEEALKICKASDGSFDWLALHLIWLLKLEVEILIFATFSQKVKHFFLVPLAWLNCFGLVGSMVWVDKIDWCALRIYYLQLWAFRPDRVVAIANDAKMVLHFHRERIDNVNVRIVACHCYIARIIT